MLARVTRQKLNQGMASQLWTVDAHCHWSDPRAFADAPARLLQNIAKGIAGFVLGGVDPADWDRQTALAEQFPGKIWRSFGLHPYFVAEQTPETLNHAWDLLNAKATSAEALGETGLDFRKIYLQSGPERQLQYFRQHLQLAGQLDKPVVLHIVRAHSEALKELKACTPRGMVHAFTAGPKVAKHYLDLGLFLSVGAKLLFPEAHDLRESVRQTPLDRLLLESDCPDQAPPGQSVHDSTTVWAVAEAVAQSKSLPLARVVEQTRQNLFQLMRKEIRP